MLIITDQGRETHLSVFLRDKSAGDTPFSSFLVDTNWLLAVISFLLLRNNPTQK